jgi:hypothetical protein
MYARRVSIGIQHSSGKLVHVDRREIGVISLPLQPSIHVFPEQVIESLLPLQLNPPKPSSHLVQLEFEGTVVRCEGSIKGELQDKRLQSLPPKPGLHLHVLPPHTPLFKQP